MDYNSKNRFGEFKRILNNHNASILSTKFYLRYCKSDYIENKDIHRLKNELNDIFPSEVKFKTTDHSDLGKVISIMPGYKNFIFGYAGLDQFNRICLLPKHGEKFIFLGIHNQEKFDSYINGQYITSRNNTVNFYNKNTASYLNNWLDFCSASDLELNFVVDYPNPIDKGKYVVNSFCWNTKLTDNFINIEKCGG